MHMKRRQKRCVSRRCRASADRLPQAPAWPDSARTDADMAVAPAVRGPHVHVGRVGVGQLHQMDLRQVPETLRPQRLLISFLFWRHACRR